ncbi:MAG: AMP nucleosidase, partial [Mesorhizobium sp.]|nr:AMP nucleosidase [Mesorhizobium sp.]
MEKRIYPEVIDTVVRPEPFARQSFTDATEAVQALKALYSRNTEFLRNSFASLPTQGPSQRFRAYYPEVGVFTQSFAQIDSRYAYGHMHLPGHYSTTITRPDLFETYLVDQLALIMRNHGVPITVSESETPIPLHFAFLEGTHVDGSIADLIKRPLRDIFDVPDLTATDDLIANGTYEPAPGEPMPLAPFTAQRIDYSLHRLSHYTATSPNHFQNFVLFTNYQFYIDEFIRLGHAEMANPASEYIAFVEPGNVVMRRAGLPAEA